MTVTSIACRGSSAAGLWQAASTTSAALANRRRDQTLAHAHRLSPFLIREADITM
jgi:hypothetical protein